MDISTRREFMKSVGIAGAAVGGVTPGRAAQREAPNKRLNVGLIGVGIRGYQLHGSILRNQHARVAAISDISDHYIERIKPQLEDPGIPVHRDYGALLDDDRIDAVVIVFGILMSHPLDAANLVMDLEIPETAYATGGIYRFDDGRTVPDTWSALFNYPSRGLTVSFVGCSTNQFLNQESLYRGSEGTMELSQSRLKVFAERRNDLFDRFARPGVKVDDFRTHPIVDRRARGNATAAHLDDFLRAVMSRGETKAPIEQCFKAMVGVAMAIQSYQSGKSARWDANHERILVEN